MSGKKVTNIFQVIIQCYWSINIEEEKRVTNGAHQYAQHDLSLDSGEPKVTSSVRDANISIWIN